jgi:hypothetical protein
LLALLALLLGLLLLLLQAVLLLGCLCGRWV